MEEQIGTMVRKGNSSQHRGGNIPQEKRRYIIGVDDEELCQGIMDGTIPSTIADSGATSGIRTEDDPSHHTGEPSDKRFILPSGKVWNQNRGRPKPSHR